MSFFKGETAARVGWRLYPTNEIRVREKMLKRCYAHYATLELYSATTKKITWKTVQDLNATLNFDEFLMWLLNFEVVPYLMTRAEATAIFNEVGIGGERE